MNKYYNLVKTCIIVCIFQRYNHINFYNWWRGYLLHKSGLLSMVYSYSIWYFTRNLSRNYTSYWISESCNYYSNYKLLDSNASMLIYTQLSSGSRICRNMDRISPCFIYSSLIIFIHYLYSSMERYCDNSINTWAWTTWKSNWSYGIIIK